MTKFTDYLYDILQNSIQVQASHIQLLIKLNDLLQVTIINNGPGMTPETLRQVRSFSYTSRTTRKVGLGLSLIHDLTQQTEGYFEITSDPQGGTTLQLGFNPNHIDFPEMGDLALLVADMYIHQDVQNFTFTYQHCSFDFESMGLTQHPKTFKQRQYLYQTIHDKLIEVAHENTR